MILSVFITVISGHDKPQPPGCLLGVIADWPV
ncbi:IS66 family insertion sequence element accessory protein TnpB, partial [Escherichia coli]|nr:IS66 family insertion sequence element accessory protein TnpB [Escherichia coli]